MDTWFSAALIKWYRQHKRDLPWRHETDAYKIWLSEIILQQTQVAQGLSYYLKFTETYPDIGLLAAADEDSVLKLWQGLGYYSRARNLHAAAKFVAGELKSVFPDTYEAIKQLKGVGDYTAAAIASFAYQLPHAVVDGNVYRVLSRVFGIETPIDSSAAKKEFQQLAQALLNKKDAATHNQAVMEFGSQFCRPVNPDCPNCVLQNKCIAYKTGRVAQLPIKTKKTKVRNRFFNYLVVLDPTNKVLIYKRQAGDIWQGLYEFYLLESEAPVTTEQVLEMQQVTTLCGTDFTVQHISKTYKHVLSHQHLYARFYVIHVALSFKDKRESVRIDELSDYAFPRLMEKFFDDGGLKEIV